MTQRLAWPSRCCRTRPCCCSTSRRPRSIPDGLCAFYGLIEARRRHGQTVLFSSHQMGDVERLADRFAVLVGGRLVASFTARELTDELADRGVMKVTLDRRPPDLLDAVRRIAPKAVWAADQLIVPAPAAARLAVLDIVRASGAEIRGLTAEEGRLDAFYRELVGRRGRPCIDPAGSRRPVSRPLLPLRVGPVGARRRRRSTPRTTPCGYCRMIVSDQRFASQIVAPYEEPRFFDDLGCLARYLTGSAGAADGRGRLRRRPSHEGVGPRRPRRLHARRHALGADGLAHHRARDRRRRAMPTPRRRTARRWRLRDVFPGVQLPGGVAMIAGRRSALWLCARQELLLSVRSRWTQTFAVVFAVLALAVASSGYVLSGGSGLQDFARTSASLVQLVLLLVPLTSLLFGVMALTPEPGAAELLFSQPVARRTILAGKLLGLLPRAHRRAGDRLRRRRLVLFARDGIGRPGRLSRRRRRIVRADAVFLSLAAAIAAGDTSARRARNLAVALVDLVRRGRAVRRRRARRRLAPALRARPRACSWSPRSSIRSTPCAPARCSPSRARRAFGAASLAFLRFTGGVAGAAVWLSASVIVWILVPLGLAARRVSRADIG